MRTNPASNCLDCGVECDGDRCRKHYVEAQRRAVLARTATDDRELLQLVADEKLTGPRLAARLNISRIAGARRIRVARQREVARALLEGLA